MIFTNIITNIKRKNSRVVGGISLVLLVAVYPFSSLADANAERQQEIARAQKEGGRSYQENSDDTEITETDIKNFKDRQVEIKEEAIASVRAQQKKAIEGKDIVLKEEIVSDPDNRAWFIIQYPEFSNAKMKKTIDDFLAQNKKEFKEIMKAQEVELEKHRDETGEFPFSFAIERILTFEVPVFSEKLKAVRFIVAESRGGTGSEDTVLFTFGEQGDVMSSKDFFVDFDTALQVLSDMVTEDLLLRFGEGDVFSEGAEPSPDNYNNITFDEAGNLVVYFDKYQVSSGANGSVTVTLEQDTIKALVTPEVLKLFD